MDWNILVVTVIVIYVAYTVRDIAACLERTTEVKTKRDLALIKEIENLKREVEALKKRYQPKQTKQTPPIEAVF